MDRLAVDSSVGSYGLPHYLCILLLMYYYIENRSTDPCYNLALEQWMFDTLDRSHSYCMLWQNDNAVIVGKHQNTNAEINTTFVKEQQIKVVRRLSGGGAVYHDRGNLNFTFITDAAGGTVGSSQGETLDFSVFCRPIQQALISFGVPVEISGRNDMFVSGKKISGNAQYIKQGRIMHHGTILYDVNLDYLSQALNPKKDTINSKGIPSIHSGVANIRPCMAAVPASDISVDMSINMSIDEFRVALKARLMADFNMAEYTLSSAEEAEVAILKENVYSQWAWNYGASPPFNIRKTRRIEGCGNFEILIDVEKGGIIRGISFFGDFFGSTAHTDLTALLVGHTLEYSELAQALNGIDISQYFYNLDTENFLALLLD